VMVSWVIGMAVFFSRRFARPLTFYSVTSLAP
jgi:hypothetical protein